MMMMMMMFLFSQFIFWPLFPPTKYCWEVIEVHVSPLVHIKADALRLHVHYSGCTTPPSTFLIIVSPSKSFIRCIVLIILITLSSSPIIFLTTLVASSTPPPTHPIITGTTSTLYLLLFSLVSNVSCWYFCNFVLVASSMFCSWGDDISTNQIFHAFSSSNVKFGLRAELVFLILCSKSRHHLNPFPFRTWPSSLLTV